MAWDAALIIVLSPLRLGELLLEFSCGVAIVLKQPLELELMVAALEPILIEATREPVLLVSALEPVLIKAT